MTQHNATPLALATRAIPRDSTAESITAIIKLTPDRAQELLALMREIASLATTSSRVFKVSTFEPLALYVPTRTLRLRPEPNNFLVLPPDFEVSAIAQIKLVHADVLPFAVCWQAYDLNNRFTLTTSEINAQILHAIASGVAIPPCTVRETFTPLPSRPRIPFFLDLPKYGRPIR
jgi:hypothetical protein